MTALFEMLTTITRRRQASGRAPFATTKSVEKWLRNLPADSDYDAHHALIEGLERFNGANEVASFTRLKVLLKLEQAGLPLQLRIVDQYVRNQATFRLARQALWRETWMFWSLLAEAWLHFLKQAYRGPASAELKPFAAQIAARAIRYAGLVMRWDYHQGRIPAGSAWRRVHKLYRLVERDGYARELVQFDTGATDCAREYALVVTMGLVHPLGFRAQEIESVAAIIQASPDLPLPETVPEREVHTHMVDLSLTEGACLLDNEWVQGRRLRYFDLRGLVAHIYALGCDADAEHAQGLTRQVASLIERGGVRRNRQRTNRFGRVWVAAGMRNILAALATTDPEKSRAAVEPWMLRDESPEGMGFAHPSAADAPNGRLVAVSWDPAEGVWQLMAIRWTRQEDGQNLIGTERLSRHPKRVEVSFDGPAPAGTEAKTWAVFLPLTHTEQGVSNLLLPPSHYRLGALMSLCDGEMIYQLRLGEVQESHEGWLRVGLEVLGRERYEAAA